MQLVQDEQDHLSKALQLDPRCLRQPQVWQCIMAALLNMLLASVFAWTMLSLIGKHQLKQASPGSEQHKSYQEKVTPTVSGSRIWVKPHPRLPDDDAIFLVADDTSNQYSSRPASTVLSLTSANERPKNCQGLPIMKWKAPLRNWPCLIVLRLRPTATQSTQRQT